MIPLARSVRGLLWPHEKRGLRMSSKRTAGQGRHTKRRGRGEGSVEVLPSGLWRGVVSLGKGPDGKPLKKSSDAAKPKMAKKAMIVARPPKKKAAKKAESAKKKAAAKRSA